MKLHANAQTCPRCRFLIASRVMSGEKPASVARDFQVSTKTIFKWVARFRAEGSIGLDSLDFIELSLAIEERFGLVLDEAEDLTAHFASFDSLSRFIAGRLGGA